MVPPPKSSLSSLIGLCTESHWPSKDSTERHGNEPFLDDLRCKMDALASGNVIRLPIGEAMLQLCKKP